MPNEFDQMNSRVEDWKNDTNAEIQIIGAGYGINHRSNSPSGSASLPTVRGKVFYNTGAAAGVSFKFRRSLIYTHTGSGKGQGGSKGSRWIDKYGIKKQTNPKSLNKANTGNRRSKPFLNDALDKQVPVLADIVADEGASIVTKKLFINS